MHIFKKKNFFSIPVEKRKKSAQIIILTTFPDEQRRMYVANQPSDWKKKKNLSPADTLTLVVKLPKFKKMKNKH